jgi:transcriptional regulator of acetoin/glycerol metabolism
MPLELQPALLRALEEMAVRSVGADHETKVDVRVVAATHTNLYDLVAREQFREDLLARLEYLVVDVLPLRSRRTEILSLARTFAPNLRFEPDAAEVLVTWSWPRNVRELRSIVESLNVLSDDGWVRTRDLARRISTARGSEVEGAQANVEKVGAEVPHRSDGTQAVANSRKARLLKLLKLHQGNVSAVARELGTSRSHVYRWMRSVGLSNGVSRED